MNAHDALLIEIVKHTNAYMKQGVSFRRFRRDPVVQAMGDVGFVLAVDGMKPRQIAGSVEDWAAWLKKENCSGLRLLRSGRDIALPERVADAFANGSSWAIETLMPGATSGFWLPDWEFSDADKDWQGSYACIAKSATDPLPAQSLETALATLIKALEDIHAFAVRQQRDNFAGIFMSALKQAREVDKLPARRGFWDTGPLSKKAQKAMDAAQAAHVFGGMGSWNDIVCDGEDQAVYERVSGELYQAMNGVMEAAVNADL